MNRSRNRHLGRGRTPYEVFMGRAYRWTRPGEIVTTESSVFIDFDEDVEVQDTQQQQSTTVMQPIASQNSVHIDQEITTEQNISILPVSEQLNQDLQSIAVSK